MELQNLQKIAQELRVRSGLNVMVKIENGYADNQLLDMKYEWDLKEITFYTRTIEIQCLQILGSLERLEEYFKVMLAHELGHVADESLPELIDWLERSVDESERLRISLLIEENAWSYALSLIAEVDLTFVSAIIDLSLKSYRNQLSAVIA